MLRRVGSVLLGLFFVLVTPRETFAIWGWLEELSGPGPFRGWEIPFEFLCWESLDAEIIPKNDLKSVWESLQKSGKAAPGKTFEEKKDLLLREASEYQRSKGDVSRSFLFCSVDKSAHRKGGYTRPSGHHVGFFAPNRPSEKQYPANNQEILEEVIDGKPAKVEVPVEYYLRHSWRPAATFAFNYARYESYRNNLLAPGNTRDEEGQVRVQFFEAILGVEILPSVELGAGIGMTKLPRQSLLHLVPVVATWRPFAAFTKHPAAYAFMTRASFRYLTRPMTRESFGEPSEPPAGVPIFREEREGIWSATLAVDPVVLFQHFFKQAP